MMIMMIVVKQLLVMTKMLVELI